MNHLLLFAVGVLISVAACSNRNDVARAAGFSDSLLAGGYVHKVRAQPANTQDVQSQGLTILYTIASVGAGEAATNDIMFDGLTSGEAFTVRLRDIALRMHNDVWLDLDNVRYACIGSLMPYDLGLAPTKSVYLTFNIPTSKLSGARDAVLTVKDRHFGGGLMSFLLDPKSMVNSTASIE